MPDFINHGQSRRRTILKTSGAMLAGGTLAGCQDAGGSGGDSGDTQTQKLVVSQTGFEMGTIPNTVAVREFLQESSDGQYQGTLENLTDTNLQMQALLSGDTDVYTSSLGALYQAHVAGNDFKVLSTKVAGTDYVIVVRDEVESLSDFENSDLKMGVSGVGGLSHVQTVGILQANDVNPENVDFIAIGGSSDRTAAIASGQIDGGPLHRGQLQQLQNEDASVWNAGAVREEYPDYLENTIAIRADWLENNSEIAQAYISQLVKANQRAINDFDWIYQKTQQYQAKTLPEEDFREEWELAVEMGRWPHEEFNRKGYESVLQMMDGAGLVNADEVDLDSMLEASYFENAVENL